ncbi:MAG TPA: peroxide stress protein YaaA [Caulobacteraceae bacterium]
MLMVISPAKALNFAAPALNAPMTTPAFAEDIAELAKVTQRLRVSDLKALMGISDNLAVLNRERFQAFDPESEDGLQAVFAFNGDVYTGLAARELDAPALKWAQDRLRILSGLYGLLRPLDVIQPYRLEMGSRLKTKRGKSLYDFWGQRLSLALNEAAGRHADPTLVNLASQEYFGAVKAAALSIPTVTCHFREERDGQMRTLSFFAKRARGAMTRYAIDQRIDRAHDLKAFDRDGYAFRPALSSDTDWVFAR